MLPLAPAPREVNGLDVQQLVLRGSVRVGWVGLDWCQGLGLLGQGPGQGPMRAPRAAAPAAAFRPRLLLPPPAGGDDQGRAPRSRSRSRRPRPRPAAAQRPARGAAGGTRGEAALWGGSTQGRRVASAQGRQAAPGAASRRRGGPYVDPAPAPAPAPASPLSPRRAHPRAAPTHLGISRSTRCDR